MMFWVSRKMHYSNYYKVLQNEGHKLILDEAIAKQTQHTFSK